MSKSAATVAPTYNGTSTPNYGVATIVYKDSAYSATVYNAKYSVTAYSYNPNSLPKSFACCSFYKNATTLNCYIGNSTSSTIGLAPETEYVYYVAYSS
mgnify:CR=1 FL=1